ncbi:MAG: IS21-like element helper ATPase IstB [Dehalococcoidia bacterium]
MGELVHLQEQLKRLGLHTMATHVEREVATATKSQSSYTAFLQRLVEEELATKMDRSINARMAKARFLTLRTLEGFEFSFQADLPATLVKELARLDFLDRAENVVTVGPPGTGKTHLLTALGVKACEARKRVLFVHAPALLEQLVASTANGSLGRKLSDLRRLDFLIIDELGYLPMDSRQANLFFQLVSTRYEQGSIGVSTNKPFDQWGQIFGGDDVIAAAILDRLLHHSHILVTHGPSYRMKDKAVHRRDPQYRDSRKESVPAA